MLTTVSKRREFVEAFSDGSGDERAMTVKKTLVDCRDWNYENRFFYDFACNKYFEIKMLG